jgi:hypothetical protein
MDWQIIPILMFMAFCLYATALIIKEKDNE